MPSFSSGQNWGKLSPTVYQPGGGNRSACEKIGQKAQDQNGIWQSKLSSMQTINPTSNLNKGQRSCDTLELFLVLTFFMNPRNVFVPTRRRTIHLFICTVAEWGLLFFCKMDYLRWQGKWMPNILNMLQLPKNSISDLDQGIIFAKIIKCCNIATILHKNVSSFFNKSCSHQLYE